MRRKNNYEEPSITVVSIESIQAILVGSGSDGSLFDQVGENLEEDSIF